MNEQEKEIFRLSYLSETKKTKIFTQILTDIVNTKQKAKTKGKPLLRIIMGFPGSGKTSLAKASGENFVHLGKDDMLAYHPNLFKLNQLAPVRLNSKERDCYDFAQITNPDGEKESLVEQFAEEAFWVALDFCQTQGYNVIVDGLPSEEMLDIAENAKGQGYAVDFVIPVMPKRLLELNIATRYERGQEEFDEALAGKRSQSGVSVPHPYTKMRLAPDTVREAANVVRAVESLGYPLKIINSLSGVELNQNQDASVAWIEELSRPISDDEKKYVADRLKVLHARQENRGASRYDRAVVAALERD